MKILTGEQVSRSTKVDLGIGNSSSSLVGTASLAALLRRAASLFCPCSPGTLTTEVLRCLEGLADITPDLKAELDQTLDQVIAHGDLLEAQELPLPGESSRGLVVYLAPPGFLLRVSGACLVFGILPDAQSFLSRELEEGLEFLGHVRRIPQGKQALREELLQLGLCELKESQWLREPSRVSPQEYQASLSRSLAAVPPSQDISGLEVIDHQLPVHYYRGRWVTPKAHSGMYVGRRPQAYGAQIWCLVQLRNGQAVRALDLPLQPELSRGCDEAWRIQMALDSLRGEPQQFRVTRSSTGSARLELFSPLPQWACRRWDTLGCPGPTKGCLFSYDFDQLEIEQEIRYATEVLWLAERRVLQAKEGGR